MKRLLLSLDVPTRTPYDPLDASRRGGRAREAKLDPNDERAIAKRLADPVLWGEDHLHNRDGSPRRYGTDCPVKFIDLKNKEYWWLSPPQWTPSKKIPCAE